MFIEENPPSFAACAKPQQPQSTYPYLEGRPQISEKNQAMTDVMALALACDQTRVFSNFITSPVNNLLYEGAEKGHHQLTHEEVGDQPQVHKIVLTLIEEYARLLDGLKAIPEGGGTLLDNTLILATTDTSEGRVHSLDEYPIVLAGSAGGSFKSGVHYREKDANATKVLITIQQALGIDVTKFGVGDGQAEGGIGTLLT